MQLLPGESCFLQVQVEPGPLSHEQFLVECNQTFQSHGTLAISDSLIQLEDDSTSKILAVNPSGFTQVLEQRDTLGNAFPVTVETPAVLSGNTSRVLRVNSGSPDREEWRKQKLEEVLEEPDLPEEDRTVLLNFLTGHHGAFCLEKGERGETDLVQMEVNIGDARPKRHPLRRMPLAVRREISRLLDEMQRDGVIEPSQSPWASPVVLVRKKDSSHRFCVDYRGLNAVTTADSFPLPRIDDLLDQLGNSQYFSTIDLASGFWQIRMHPSSQEKTAFVVPQGLYEFRVMPFGLTNAPGVFQRLMQRVLADLNPPDGPEFVSVYLDDILVFSRSLEEHLRRVIHKLEAAGLKLKPSKCHFAKMELEYLGHVITREGLKTNPKLVEAVSQFPTPRNIHSVRQFLGLASYYRRFVRGFARIASPLHYLTRKDARWLWTPQCELAFQKLKSILTTAPILAYPNFDRRLSPGAWCGAEPGADW